MSSLLEQTIRETETQLSAVNVLLQGHAVAISRGTEDLQHLLDEIRIAEDRLEQARMLVNARDEAARRLDLILLEASRTMASGRGPNYIVEGGRDVRFDVVRLLAMQAYLASSWSLYDTLWEAVHRILLPRYVLADRSKPPTLLSSCINGKRSQSGRLGEMLTQLHGWSIGASYYVRNRFLHDGGSALLPNVFEGPDVASEYRIAAPFLDDIRQRCKASDWGLGEHMTWRSGTWPSSHDLKTLLEECHADADEAFRRMLRWTVVSAQEFADAVVEVGK